MKPENEKLNTEEFDTETNMENEEEVTKSCCEATHIPDETKVEKAIKESVYASMGIGIVPVPLINIAAVTASNLNLTRKLSKLYGVEFKEGIAKKIIAAVTGASVGVFASPVVETAVIGFPLVGLPLAVATKPAINGMTTYAVGRMFVTHFERGGSFLGANIDVMKEDFATAFKNSRQWLGNVISGKEKEEPAKI